MFPAYAGMIPPQNRLSQSRASVPRIRGDDPSGGSAARESLLVFPAYAGMIHVHGKVRRHVVGVPRICGDDPALRCFYNNKIRCSPHTRG